MRKHTTTLAALLGLALMAAYPVEASANQYTVRNGEKEHYEETLRDLGYTDGVGHSDADIAKIAKDIIRANPSKLTDDPNVTPRYIKPICGKDGHTYEFGYGGINIGSKDMNFHATYLGNPNVYQKENYYPELYMYNAAIANDIAHEMGHWYGNTDDYDMAEEDRADNYAMEFSEPLEYGSYAGQWRSYSSGVEKGKNHKETKDDAQDALDYIEKASKGHIKFDGDGHGYFNSFAFDGTTFLQENTTISNGVSSPMVNAYPKIKSDSEKWDDFVVDESIKKLGIKESFNPEDKYHIAYVAAQIAFAIKYNVFDNAHSHLMNAWDFWHGDEVVTAENKQHHDTLSKWTVLYFDNPVSGGRKIVDIYPYTQDELLEKAYRFDSLIKSAPSSGDAYAKWCNDNFYSLNNEPAIALWYICYCMTKYNNL